MKKRGFRIIIMALLIVCLLVIEIQFVKAQSETIEYEGVWMLKTSKLAGDTIQAKDIALMYIDKNQVSHAYFIEKEKNEMLNKKIKVDFEPSIPLMKTILEEENKGHHLSKDDAMTSFKLLPEQSLCFQMAIGDTVQLMIIDPRREFERPSTFYQTNNENKKSEGFTNKVVGIYENLQIVSIYNGDMIAYEKGDEQLPMYVTLSGKAEIIETIIQHKPTGEFEIYQSNK